MNYLPVKLDSTCVSGGVSVVGEGAAGMVPVRTFKKISPSSKLSPPLAKAELISTSVIHLSKRGNLLSKGLSGVLFCFRGEYKERDAPMWTPRLVRKEAGRHFFSLW